MASDTRVVRLKTIHVPAEPAMGWIPETPAYDVHLEAEGRVLEDGTEEWYVWAVTEPKEFSDEHDWIPTGPFDSLMAARKSCR